MMFLRHRPLTWPREKSNFPQGFGSLSVVVWHPRRSRLRNSGVALSNLPVLPTQDDLLLSNGQLAGLSRNFDRNANEFFALHAAGRRTFALKSKFELTTVRHAVWPSCFSPVIRPECARVRPKFMMFVLNRTSESQVSSRFSMICVNSFCPDMRGSVQKN